MKNLIVILLLTFISGSVNSQTYRTEEVIDKAESYLKLAVGDELFKYFKLDPDSYYEYKARSGKSKWGNINKGKWTKGTFVNGKAMRFILDHPEFPYRYVNKRTTVSLTAELELESEINIDRIPDFL